MMDTPDTTAMMESRYIRQSDPKTDTLVFRFIPHGGAVLMSMSGHGSLHVQGTWCWMQPAAFRIRSNFGSRSIAAKFMPVIGMNASCQKRQFVQILRLILVSRRLFICPNITSPGFTAHRPIWLSCHIVQSSLTAYSVSLFWNIWTRARCCGLFANSLGC